MDMLSVGPAGQGAGRADRPARGSVDRHRPFRVRRAQRAARDDGDGTGRHVRAAGDERRSLCAARAPRARARLPRTGTVQRVCRLAAAAGELPPYLTAAAAREVARVSGVHLRRRGRRRTGRAGSRSRTTAIPTPTGRLTFSSMPTRRSSACERTRRSPSPTSCCATAATPRISPSCRASAGTRRCCPPDEWLALEEGAAAERVPYVLAVDGEDRLHRVIVDARLMQAARRCLLLWHRLQEHGGIHDSHAERLLATREGRVGGRAPAGAGGRGPSRVRHERGGRCSACRRDLYRAGRASGSRTAALGRGVDRDLALPELQRMPEHQRPDVHVQREQAGLHQGHHRRDVPPAGRGGRGLPGGDHPSRASRAIRTSPGSRS